MNGNILACSHAQRQGGFLALTTRWGLLFNTAPHPPKGGEKQQVPFRGFRGRELASMLGSYTEGLNGIQRAQPFKIPFLSGALPNLIRFLTLKYNCHRTNQNLDVQDKGPVFNII